PYRARPPFPARRSSDLDARRCGKRGDLAHLRRDFREIRRYHRERDLLLLPQRLQGLLHAIRLALYRVDEHAGYILPVDTAGLEGVLGSGILVSIVYGMSRRKNLVPGPAGRFERCYATNGDDITCNHFPELIKIQCHLFSPLVGLSQSSIPAIPQRAALR